MTKGLILGIAIGVGVGWLLFARSERPVHSRAPRQPDTTQDLVPRGDVAAAIGAEEIGTDSENRGTTHDGSPVQAKSVEELHHALARAREARDWESFEQAIGELGAAKTSEAQALLVEIMGDDTLFMPPAWLGQLFCHYLKDSQVEGILAAARTRAEVALKDNPGTRWACRGWLSLVALHGGEADLDWIESLGTSSKRRREVDRALAEGACNPLAAERLAERLLRGESSFHSGELRAFARENPTVAFRTAATAFPEASRGNQTGVLTLLGRSTTEATLEEAVRLLTEIDEPIGRMQALRSVNLIHRRRLDISGFQPLLDDLRSIFERAARGEIAVTNQDDRMLIAAALDAIRHAPCAWDESTLAALHSYAARPRSPALETLRKIEKELADKTENWQPER